MRIRFKDKDGRFRRCECYDRNCINRKCFSPGYAVHSSPGCYNGAWRSDALSCVYRDYHGCPTSVWEEETAQTAEQRPAETETQETK